MLDLLGLNYNRPWIVEENFEGRFDDYNLYKNRFNRAIGLISFIGYGSQNKAPFASCLEFTTNGMLPKCWRRINGVIKLYKGGILGASNLGNEPYSEFYASKIGQAMGVNCISYNLCL